MENKCRGLKITMLLVLSLTLVLLFSSCASRPNVIWDDTFTQELNPDADIMQKLSGSVQNIDLQSSRDDVTVHVKQTLGDAKTLYIALDIILPGERDHRDAELESNDSVAPYSITPRVCELVAGPVEYSDIKDLTPALIEHLYFSKRIMIGDGSGVALVQTSITENTFSYLMYLSGDDKFFIPDTITLIIGDFSVSKDDMEIASYPEIHLISWTPTNDAPLVEKTITTKDNKIIGSVLLSPFSFSGKVFSSDYETIDEFYQSIYFIQQDGTEFMPKKYHGSGGGFSLPGGAASQNFLFAQPLDIDTIKEIQIGGHTVKVHGAED